MTTMKQINSIFTETVSEYISKGYVFSSETAGGSFSKELMHIDLQSSSNRDEVIRVWMLEGHENLKVEDSVQYANTLSIEVRAYSKKNSSTFWPGEGKLINSKKFYEFSRRKFYVESEEELLKLCKVSYSRFPYRYSHKDNFDRLISRDRISDTVLGSIMRKIHDIRGMKRAKSDCIVDIYAKKTPSGKLTYIVGYVDNKASKHTLTLK